MDPTDDLLPTKPSSSNTVPIRVHKSTARLLRSIVNKCNRKSMGRRVKVDDVLTKSLSILGSSHIEEIKESTYSSQDHLEIEFKKHRQQHGSVSKDEFIKMLLSRAIPEVTYPDKQEDE